MEAKAVGMPFMKNGRMVTDKSRAITPEQAEEIGMWRLGQRVMVQKVQGGPWRSGEITDLGDFVYPSVMTDDNREVIAIFDLNDIVEMPVSRELASRARRP